MDLRTLPAFAKAIHGHNMITDFDASDFPFRCLDIMCSALLTLPALVRFSFTCYGLSPGEEVQSHESVLQLLQSPILRNVEFEFVNFTYTLCQAVAKALKERSQITDLTFRRCSFPVRGSCMIARALEKNTTLKRLAFIATAAGANKNFYQVLANTLPYNSTLQVLELSSSTPGISGSCSWLFPLFLNLQMNTGLKELVFSGKFFIDEKLSSAMKLGLDKNSTLESLRLEDIKWGGNDTSFWREAFSFLRTNRALKSLYMESSQYDDMTKSDATAFTEVLAMLRENESLETFSMAGSNARIEDYIACVAAIHPNTTLKSLSLRPRYQLRYQTLDVDDDEMKNLIPVLQKNYGLEEIPGLHGGCSEDIRSILQLNRAGRRYLVQDGSSVSKGVDVLSRVNDDINSVFLHLLENPRLCDRSAVETPSFGNIDNARLTSPPGNRHSGGKRKEPQVPHNVAQGPARIPFTDKSHAISLNCNTATLNKTAANKCESAA